MAASNIDNLARHPSPWVRAHEALSRLAKQRAQADAEEGRWLLEALRSAAHVHLGFGTFGEYIERLFGYGRRFVQERLRVAQALEQLPAIARALEEGALSWSAVRELTRVTVKHTKRAWLELAYGKTIRELERLVAGKHPGDTPDAPSDPSAQRHALRFDVSAETFALFREAMSELRRRMGSAVSEDAALFEMARHILGPTPHDSRSPYQIALSVCPDCGRGTQQASGQMVPVDAHIVEMASCDAQHLGRIDAQPANDAQSADHLRPANDAHAPAERKHTHVGARARQTIPTPSRTASRRARRGRHRRFERLFRHSDGSPYGNIGNPRRFDLQTKLFTALRNLGFRESEARAAVAQLRADATLANAPIEQWLRAALQRMTR